MNTVVCILLRLADSLSGDAASVQYLQYPEKVVAEIYRVLKPGGIAIFSFSNRMFFTKVRQSRLRYDLLTSDLAVLHIQSAASRRICVPVLCLCQIIQAARCFGRYASTNLHVAQRQSIRI